MKKYWKIIVVVLSLAILMFALWFQFPQWSFIGSDIEKVYCKATLKDNFAEDTILILLTNEASLENIDHDYTPEDFAEIGCVEVRDLSSATTEKIRAQLRGEELSTSDRPGATMFSEPKDVTQFKRILCLKLDKESKFNVLFVIKILEHRDDIYSAAPDYIYQLVD